MGAVNVMAGADGGPGADGAGGTSGANQSGQNGQSQANQNKKCDKKVSDSERAELRKQTPSDANRKQIQRQKACYACLRPIAALDHPLEADHIVPFKEITQKPGFACLKKADQLKVINNPKNIVGLCKNCNGSKGARTWNDWKGHSKIGLQGSAATAGKNLAASRQGMLSQQINQMPWFNS